MYTLTARLPDVLARLRVIQVTATALALLVSALAIPAAASGGTISGVVFEDTDRDGRMQSDEAPMPEIIVHLADASGSVISGARTGADGTYAISGLPDGEYTVLVSYDSYQAMRTDWVPTTTASLEPRIDVSLAGTATADFGWRRIVRSTDVSRPISEVTTDAGLRVQSFDDVVSAQEIADSLVAGSLLGEEQPVTTVRFDLGGSSYCAMSVGGEQGSYSGYRATCYVSYLSWLNHRDTTLFHEYGHAWSLYHAYIVQQDASLSGYLTARGLEGDPRLNSSHNWNVRELIAEDYRQLFGSPTARATAPDNQEIPPASEVPGLLEYLRDTFTTSPTSSPTPPAPSTDAAPQVAITSPGDGTTVSGTVQVEVAADDDGAVSAVALSVDGGTWTPASLDPSTGRYTVTVDTTLLGNGAAELVARATDDAGQVVSSDPVTVTVDNPVKGKGKGGGGGGNGGGGKGGPKR